MINEILLALASFLGLNDKQHKPEDPAYHIFVDASHKEKSAFWKEVGMKANEDQRKTIAAADKLRA